MVDDATREYVIDKTSAIESRIKLWVIGGVCANLIPIIGVAYMLGGISQDFKQGVRQLGEQQLQMASDRTWRIKFEQRQMGVEQWAKTKGYAALQSHREGDDQ